MSTTHIKRFARNTAGRDLAVGDIHGHFSRLDAALKSINFDPARDRLFSVGDLVDRGPESEDADEWLSRSWFHAVRGNHEQMAIDAAQGFTDPSLYAANGGAWFMALPREHQRCIADTFIALPFALEIETADGVVVIVHADCPVRDWRDMEDAFAGPNSAGYELRCLWDRDRINNMDRRGVAGIRALIVGHTPVKRATSLDNVYYIDTGGWFRGGHFTFIDLATLETIPAAPQKLEWEPA